MGAWSHVLGLGLGGRDHGPYGGHVFGVQELFAQSTFVWSPRVGLTAQLALAHHGALRADPNSGEPSDTLATSVEDRLQPGWSVGWTWLFGRARLDLLKGGVLDNPTPGFKTRYNKAQILMAVHPSLDVFAALRFSHWRADYVAAGIALRWGRSQKECISCPRWDM